MTDQDSSSTKKETDSRPLTLFLAGDVMTGRGIDQIYPQSVDPVLFEPYVKTAAGYVQLGEEHSGTLPRKVPYHHVWGDGLTELVRINPDARIINLETAVTINDEPWPRKMIHYRMHPGNAKLLSEAEIDVCVLGNNHVMDWSIDGLRETLHVLEARGLMTCGAGLNSDTAAAPAVVNTENGRLLVFSYATSGAGIPKSWEAKKEMPGVNFLNDLGKSGAKRVLKNVQLHRKESDRIVISIHWGSNWGYEVPNNQQKFAYFLIDNGAADVIHGHSSHHPKGIEVYKDRLILYGCGDLINDYEGITGHEQYRGELSLMYFPMLDESGSLISLRMSPMKIHRFQLTKAEVENIDWLAEKLNRVCNTFDTKIEKTDDGELVLHWESKPN